MSGMHYLAAVAAVWLMGNQFSVSVGSKDPSPAERAFWIVVVIIINIGAIIGLAELFQAVDR